jgi:NADPH2:quinone reductase
MNNVVLVTKYGGLDALQYKEIEMPSIGSKQVLIRTAATSVNFADIKARIGKYHGAKKPPYVPGLDLAGTVEAIGSEVTTVKVGQRVIAFPNNGSYAEYTTADEVLTFPIPNHIDFDTAAACPTVSFTSYNLLVQCANINQGETVLIHAAAGGIGTTAVQLAKLLGSKTVIGTVGSDEKITAVEEAGADYVINYQKEDFVQQVLNFTNNEGVDIILDSVSGDIFENSLKCLSRFGRIVNFGNAKGSTAGQVNTSELHASCRSVLGYSLGTTRKYRPESLKETAEAVIPYLESGQLKMFIGKRFKLKDAALAQEWVESRKSTGKVLLYP